MLLIDFEKKLHKSIITILLSYKPKDFPVKLEKYGTHHILRTKNIAINESYLFRRKK